MQILCKPEEFEAVVNKIYCEKKVPLRDGYAPFCKHLFVENWTPTPNTMIKITKDNEHLLRHAILMCELA